MTQDPLPIQSGASRFRKKPVEIWAMQFVRLGAPGTGGWQKTNGEDIASWCGGRYRAEAKASDQWDVAQWIDIPTLEGVMRADIRDWVVRGVKGEHYPVKPDIFELTYERVEPEMTERDRRHRDS